MNFHSLGSIGQCLSEASSWAGAAAVLAGIMGFHVSTDMITSSLGVLVAIGGLMGVIVKEHGSS